MEYVAAACQNGVLLVFLVGELVTTEIEEDAGTKFQYLLTKVQGHLNLKTLLPNASCTAANSTGVTIACTMIVPKISRM